MDLDLVTEKLNTLGESRYEYETCHPDAGSNYAHMPSESWESYDDLRLKEYCREKEIDVSDIEIDELSDLVLDNFTMTPNHGFSMGNGSFLVASYPVGEIEIEIAPADLGIGEFTKDLCESLSRSSDVFLRYDSKTRAFGYIDGSYDVWDFEVSEDILRDLVADLRSRK